MSAAQRPGVSVFLTGLPGAGESTIADALVADRERNARARSRWWTATSDAPISPAS